VPASFSSIDRHQNRRTEEATPIFPSVFSLIAQENGRVSLSVNGIGHGSDSGSSSAQIGVLKPSPSAKVRKAFLFASTWFNRNAAVKLHNEKIDWEGMATRSNGRTDLRSFYADVTAVVKTIIDEATAGELLISVEETLDSRTTDGEILAVIFEDPMSPTSDNGVSLFFGADGGTFTLNLASPITEADLEDESSRMDLSLGIGFSYQGNNNEGGSNVDFCEVVSGRLLWHTKSSSIITQLRFFSL
jgi:hypothetical protein